MAEWSLQDARNRFSALVNAALDGVPQTVTRRGAPAVIVLAVQDYHRLCQKKVPTFIEHLLAIPTGEPGDVFDSPPLRLRDIEW